MGARPDTKAKRLQAAHDISLEVVLVARTESQQQALHDALRLLAVWAVRAARTHTAESDPDCQQGQADPHGATSGRPQADAGLPCGPTEEMRP